MRLAMIMVAVLFLSIVSFLNGAVVNLSLFSIATNLHLWEYDYGDSL